jgi:hypothetical protein
MAIEDSRENQLADPEMFRAPTPAEHRLAAKLFVGFAAGFVMLFVVLRGHWFRWVFLGIALYSFLDGVRHWRQARRTS